MISSLFVIAVIKAVFLVPWKWIEDFIRSKFVLKLSDISYVSSVRQGRRLNAEISQGDSPQCLQNTLKYISACKWSVILTQKQTFWLMCIKSSSRIEWV